MSREEVAAFIRNVQISLDTLQKQLDQSISSLPSVKRDDLPRFLNEQKRRLIQFHDEQLEEWKRFAEEAGLELEEAEAVPDSSEASTDTTPFNVRLRSLEQRVAAMGGIPALGATVLPRMTPGQKASLVATSSPAAVEMLRGRLGTDADAAVRLRKTSSDEPAAATPLVQLRKTNLGGAGHGAGGGAAGTPGAAPPNSELAAAIQRRAQQRQQQQGAGSEEE